MRRWIGSSIWYIIIVIIDVKWTLQIYDLIDIDVKYLSCKRLTRLIFLVNLSISFFFFSSVVDGGNEQSQQRGSNCWTARRITIYVLVESCLQLFNYSSVHSRLVWREDEGLSVDSWRVEFNTRLWHYCLSLTKNQLAKPLCPIHETPPIAGRPSIRFNTMSFSIGTLDLMSDLAEDIRQEEEIQLLRRDIEQRKNWTKKKRIKRKEDWNRSQKRNARASDFHQARRGEEEQSIATEPWRHISWFKHSWTTLSDGVLPNWKEWCRYFQQRRRR